MAVLEYPEIEQLYYNFPRGGALAEGRAHRSGQSDMEISTYTTYWRLDGYREVPIQVPEVPFDTVLQCIFNIHFQTFCPLSTIGFPDILRFESLGGWRRSLQEIFRHLGMATTFTKSELWPIITQMIDENLDAMVKSVGEYLRRCLDLGHWDIDQWTFYVKDHEASASPFGEKWSVILKDPLSMNITLDKTRKWVEKYVKKWTDYVTHGNAYVYIDPKLAYAAVRSRPAEYTILNSDDFSADIVAKKWRDRKAGGIPGLSQIEAGVYKRKEKKQALEPLHLFIKTILKGTEVHFLSDEAMDLYIFLMQQSVVHCYDLKTAEKQTGLGVERRLPFACDLGHPQYNGLLAGESYSGIGPTGPMNELQIAFTLAAIRQVYGIVPKWVCIYSDNFCCDAELPKSPHYDEDRRFTGFIPDRKCFGPVSISTDNPKHRLNFTGGTQTQRQRRQYIMRPLLSIIMNNIADYKDCENFIVNVVKTKWYLEMKEREENWISSWIPEYLKYDSANSADINDRIKEVTGELVKVHTKAVDYVKRWFLVQDRDATDVTDLEVTS